MPITTHARRRISAHVCHYDCCRHVAFKLLAALAWLASSWISIGLSAAELRVDFPNDGGVFAADTSTFTVAGTLRPNEGRIVEARVEVQMGQDRAATDVLLKEGHFVVPTLGAALPGQPFELTVVARGVTRTLDGNERSFERIRHISLRIASAAPKQLLESVARELELAHQELSASDAAPTRRRLQGQLATALASWDECHGGSYRTLSTTASQLQAKNHHYVLAKLLDAAMAMALHRGERLHRRVGQRRPAATAAFDRELDKATAEEDPAVAIRALGRAVDHACDAFAQAPSLLALEKHQANLTLINAWTLERKWRRPLADPSVGHRGADLLLSADGEIVLYEPFRQLLGRVDDDGHLTAAIEPGAADVRWLQSHPGGTEMAFFDATEHKVRRFETETGAELASPVLADEGAIVDLAYGYDGGHLAWLQLPGRWSVVEIDGHGSFSHDLGQPIADSLIAGGDPNTFYVVGGDARIWRLDSSGVSSEASQPMPGLGAVAYLTDLAAVAALGRDQRGRIVLGIHDAEQLATKPRVVDLPAEFKTTSSLIPLSGRDLLVTDLRSRLVIVDIAVGQVIESFEFAPAWSAIAAQESER